MPELIEMLRLTKYGQVPAASLTFTAVDFETTALQPGRVIEIAAVRVRGDGAILGELSTLVDPGRGIDPGATWVHHITREQLDGSPAMGDVVGDLVEFCRDSVLVSHNLPFEKRFLASELSRLGISLPLLPGLCTLATSRKALSLPNHRLGTVVDALDLPAIATHAALDDARACAQTVVRLINDHGLQLCERPTFAQLPRLRTGGRCAPRIADLRAGERGWMASLMDRLPVTGIYPPDPALEAAYLELLTAALSDGKITGTEAKALATQARQAGMAAEDVRRVHTMVVRGLRAVAEQDGVITAAEERDLQRAAAALGVPELVDDVWITNVRRAAGRPAPTP